MTIGGFSAMDSLTYSPSAYKYFMSAYQSPNANANQVPVQNQNAQAQQSSNTGSQTGSVQANGGVTFKGNDFDKKKKKSNGTAWAIIGTVATIGAAALCRKAYKTGNANKESFDRIYDGFKQLWNSAKSKISNLVTKPTFQRIDDNVVCTIPNKTNRLGGDDVAELAKKAGLSTEIPALTEQGSKLRSYTFTMDGFDFTVKNGKIQKCLQEGIDFSSQLKDDLVTQAKANDLIRQFESGQRLDDLRDIVFSNHTPQAQRWFTAASANEVPKLKTVATKQFDATSDVVRAYANNNRGFAQTLKNFTEGKLDDLRIASANYDLNGVGTLKIEGDNVVGIVINGKTFGRNTLPYNLISNEKAQLFGEIAEQKDRFTNIVYTI